jgi:DNA helicase II / ATP-dependent DNA helicase PcrA
MNLKPNLLQVQAIKHREGPLLIVAGAGTGKTTVITERIKYLIEKLKVKPEHIFATTFTQKASEEMSARLDQVMPFGYQEPWIGTFHSLCDRLLKYESLEIGLDPNFKIMTQTDQWIFIKKHLFDLSLNYYRPLGNPAKFIMALINFFSRLQDELITAPKLDLLARSKAKKAESQAEEVASQRLLELALVFAEYQQLKITHSVMDYGDLITKTIDLFTQRPQLLKKYQTQFKYIHVDEFQDTNYAQYELVKLLAPPQSDPNLVVVGDDDQAIYRFRGASVANILDFKQTYPNAKEVVLTSNYRSVQPILDQSYQVIINNNPNRLEVKLKTQKKLTSHQSEIVQPEFRQFDTVSLEVDWTVSKIIELITQEKHTFQDIAVLTRSNSQLDPYVVALKRSGIPYQLISNRGLFDQAEIRHLLLFLKTLIDPHDSLNLFQFLQNSIQPLQLTNLLSLLQRSKAQSISLYDIIKNSNQTNFLPFLEMINQFQLKTKNTTVSQILQEYIVQEQYLKPFIEAETIENQLKIKNINLFFEKLKHFEAVNEDPSVISFLQTLDLWMEAGENPGQAQIEDIDTVSLMTIHAAKGLEFKAVFMGSLVSGRFPSSNRKDPIEIPEELIKEPLIEGSVHLQEERRLFYVGMTRAKRHLYLTHAKNYGGNSIRKTSGFVTETGLSPLAANHPSVQLSLLSEESSPAPAYIREGKYQITKLSYSKLNTFKQCPLKFKYR